MASEENGKGDNSSRPSSPEGSQKSRPSSPEAELEDSSGDYIEAFLVAHTDIFSNLKQRNAVKVMLVSLGVQDREDVYDIEPESLRMAYLESQANEDVITLLMVTRANRFFTSNDHHNFPKGDASSGVNIVDPLKVASHRKSRKSGLLNPNDFLVSSGAMEPSTPVRYVGGTSSRQQISDDYAASGGGLGGLGKGVSIHQALSENAIEIRDKHRLKMATSVMLILPTWDGSVEGWYSFSKKFILHMKKVGYEIVCQPGFLMTAQSLKWSAEQTVEAKSFVWDRRACII